MCSSKHRSLFIERLDKLDKEVDTMNEELINLSLNTAKRFDKLEKRLERVGVLR